MPVVPLWALLTSRNAFGQPELPLLTVVSEHGVELRDLAEGRAPSEDLSGYRVVRAGDLVVNKLWARFGAYGVSRYTGIISPAYWVLQIDPSVHPPYLHYLLRSSPYRAEVWRRSKDQPPNGFDLPWEQFRTIEIPVPEFETQRQLALILDAETARIDALIEKKRRMIELMEERKTLLLDRALEARGFRWGFSLESPAADEELPTGWKVAHLSTVLEQLTNGYVGPTRDVLVDDGVKYIQSLHIKDGKIEFERGAYYVPPEWHDERPRIHLRPEDVLIVQTGDIGQVAVVPPNFGPASCHALQIARVRRDLLQGDYLGAYLRSPFGRQSLLSRVTGALHPHLEGGIRDIPIVVPPLHVQSEVVDEIREGSTLVDRLRSNLARQIDLLREHRTALITAAVTGQLDVAKAAA